MRAATVVDLGQADVADGLVADAAVDHRLPDEHLTGSRLERVEIDVPAAQAQPVAAQLGQPVGVDEDAPALALGDEADDSRRLTRTPGDGDDVLDPADLGAGRVEQRQPHDSKGVDQLAGHAPEPTAGPFSG